MRSIVREKKEIAENMSSGVIRGVLNGQGVLYYEEERVCKDRSIESARFWVPRIALGKVITW
jgi:hypothetical protein